MYDVTVPPKNVWSVPHRVWALGFRVLGFRFFCVLGWFLGVRV